MLTFPRIVVALAAVCVLLISLPLIYVTASGSKVDFSLVIQFFLLRHVLCFVAAYPVARYGNIDTIIFAVLFIAPSLLLVHGIFIWESKGMLELWPPILFLDAALFSPALILHSQLRRSLSSLAASKSHEA
jgi:hypothetical protein